MSFDSMRRKLGAAALVGIAIGPLVAFAQGVEIPRVQAVIQVSDADPLKWNLALNNVRNVLDDLAGRQSADLEIVVYGPGIGMLRADSPVAQRVAEALNRGIKVVACENTMRAQQLSRTDMLPRIGYVDSGVVELITRQREGWAYIRP